MRVTIAKLKTFFKNNFTFKGAELKRKIKWENKFRETYFKKYAKFPSDSEIEKHIITKNANYGLIICFVVLIWIIYKLFYFFFLSNG